MQLLRTLIISACFIFLSSPSLLNANEWPEKLVGHGGPIKAISISADGKHALTSSFDYSIIYWDISSPEAKIIHRLQGHDAAVNDTIFIPNTDRAVSVSDDGSLGIWDLTKGELIKRINSSAHKVLDVVLSEDGKLAVASRWDKTARLYDLEKMQEIGIFSGHEHNVNSALFASDGKHLYTASHDGIIIEWDLATRKMLRKVYDHGWGINSIAALDDDRLMYAALDGTVGIISISQRKQLKLLYKSQHPIQGLKLSRDGSLIGYGESTGKISIHKTANLNEKERARVVFGPVWDFDYIPGTNQVFYVGLDDFARRWEISSKKLAKLTRPIVRRFQRDEKNDIGKREFERKCSVCHTLEADGANRAGPTLHKVFGREAGTLPGYLYSKALIKTDLIWNEETIGRLFDDGPDVVVPGTKMPIQKVKSVAKRQALIRYLKESTN